MTGSRKLAGVMGDPVAHSLSPRLHRFWLERHGIDGDYLPLHVKPEALATELRALGDKGFAGCNLTIPHKEAAFDVLDAVSDVAKRIGAVNTVVVQPDGSLWGTNTDAVGFMENIQSQVSDLAPYKHKAVVLGAGGAARAVCAGLLDAGFAVTLTNRSHDKAEALAAEFGGMDMADWSRRDALLEGAGLLVNTTSLGMKGKEPLLLSLDALPHAAIVTDIVYTPLLTPLLEAAKARNNQVIDGLGMLLHQAAPGFEAWFGVRPQVDEALRHHVLEGL